MRASDPIALLLDGRYADPETGQLLRAEARSVVIADSLAGDEADLVGALNVGRRLALIADATTYRVLGERVERALVGRFTVQRLVIREAPHADAETVASIARELAPGTDAVVAVGSGTLNDLSKMVALERGCPQLVFATAPSMNGYTSLSASITSDGVKRSVRAATPIAAFFDLGVLAAAPPRMIRAGLGDSVCRPTAQADWLLSHLLLGRPYREAPFALLASDEPELLERAAALVAGDLVAMRHLVRTLVLSGFGMTLCGGSFPASQGEHLVSHYAEMMRPHGVPEPFHGEQIGVCSIAMASLQDRVLASDVAPVVRPTAVTREDVIAHFGPIAGEACWQELAQKRLDAAAAEELNARLAREWGTIRARLAAVTLGAAPLTRVLRAAGAAALPGELGWSEAFFAAALQHAREIRNRYTFLDLVADAGW
ncbi:MAG TPA: iron-containing alcohol dehydrogenase [Kofleriaceae bacterium]|nr:iron-containing alcohol dehydrogenase [Kofleriaceae bacterium]